MGEDGSRPGRPQTSVNLTAVAGGRAGPLYPFADLPVGLDHTTKILSEAILVQDPRLGVRAGQVPETTGVRTDLIGNEQFTGCIESKLQLEIHQLQSLGSEERAEHGIDAS